MQYSYIEPVHLPPPPRQVFESRPSLARLPAPPIARFNSLIREVSDTPITKIEGQPRSQFTFMPAQAAARPPM
jgi:hypothetical protein